MYVHSNQSVVSSYNSTGLEIPKASKLTSAMKRDQKFLKALYEVMFFIIISSSLSTYSIEKKRTHKIINPAVIRFVLFVGRLLFLVTLKRITDGTNHISQIKVPW